MARIERGHRILKDHLHAPAQRPPRPLVERGNIIAVEYDRARGRLDQAEQRASERGLAGTGLADNADGLALADANVDAVQDNRPGESAGEVAGRPAVRNH